MLAPTPCLIAGCENKTTGPGGKCEEHKPKPWTGSTRKARLPRDWQARRIIVLRRDLGVCYLCGEPGADTVDHIKQGDNHDLSNLAPVHDRTPPYCHRYKSSAEGTAALRGGMTKRRF